MTAKKTKLYKIAQQIDEAIKGKNLDAAQGLAEKLLTEDRSAGLAYLGLISLNREKWEDAERYLLESYQLNAKQNLALANLIPTYLKLRQSKKAVAFGEQAYASMPTNLSVATNYVAALLTEQQHSRALEVLKPHHNPDNPSLVVISNLISIYRALFMKEEVDSLMMFAEERFGDRPEMQKLRAESLTERDPQAALDAHKKVLAKDPESIPLRWNMSLMQLRCGEFAEGWINYDNGLLPEVGKIGRPLPQMFEGGRRIIDMDTIDPQKWTFAVCEQGIGDQVLFLGVLNKFLKEFPKTVLVAEKRMRPILERSFPRMPVYSYGSGVLPAMNPEMINGFVPIGSFQKRYRNSREEFLATRSIYLNPDQAKVAKFRNTLLAKTGAKKVVGFSWKGGYWERAQKTKTLDIELWDPIFRRDDIIFVSLQYGEVAKEKEYTAARYKNVRWIDGLDFKKDLDGWFALSCACDEILSVSTALVHFAGAAGRSVHLMLSDRGAPFIWGLQGEESIAYPDVKIHRKGVDEPSDQFFDRVAQKALANLTSMAS
jgi:tetratricopeptide (TPR) repeat protein